MRAHHILIIGSGSVGSRHARNLLDLGCRLSLVDPSYGRLGNLSTSVGAIGTYKTLEDALESDEYSGAVICSPTIYHVEQSISAVEHGVPILLEKPIGMNLDEAKRLFEAAETTKSNRSPILLGYTWRWCEALRRFRELIQSNYIGNIYHARFMMSAHLADWHPGESYQEFFMSKKELGGGALLDESHWIDQMIWMFGLPDNVVATVDTISNLKITSDDSVEILALYREGLKILIHLDIFGRPHEKSIKAIGENGTIEWVDMSDCSILRFGSHNQEETIFHNERNDMFVGVAKDFVGLLDGEKMPICSVNEGIEVMKVIDAIRVSSDERRIVSLNEIR